MAKKTIIAAALVAAAFAAPAHAAEAHPEGFIVAAVPAAEAGSFRVGDGATFVSDDGYATVHVQVVQIEKAAHGERVMAKPIAEVDTGNLVGGRLFTWNAW